MQRGLVQGRRRVWQMGLRAQRRTGPAVSGTPSGPSRGSQRRPRAGSRRAPVRWEGCAMPACATEDRQAGRRGLGSGEQAGQGPRGPAASGCCVEKSRALGAGCTRRAAPGQGDCPLAGHGAGSFRVTGAAERWPSPGGGSWGTVCQPLSGSCDSSERFSQAIMTESWGLLL